MKTKILSFILFAILLIFTSCGDGTTNSGHSDIIDNPQFEKSVLDKIKENIASGKKVDIAEIFSENSPSAASKNEAHINISENAPALDLEEDEPFVMPEFDESALNPKVVPRETTPPTDTEEDTYDGLEDVDIEEGDASPESKDFELIRQIIPRLRPLIQAELNNEVMDNELVACVKVHLFRKIKYGIHVLDTKLPFCTV